MARRRSPLSTARKNFASVSTFTSNTLRSTNDEFEFATSSAVSPDTYIDSWIPDRKCDFVAFYPNRSLLHILHARQRNKIALDVIALEIAAACFLDLSLR